MWIGPVLSDKLGRKIGMMSLTGVLLIASPVSSRPVPSTLTDADQGDVHVQSIIIEIVAKDWKIWSIAKIMAGEHNVRVPC